MLLGLQLLLVDRFLLNLFMLGACLPTRIIELLQLLLNLFELFLAATQLFGLLAALLYNEVALFSLFLQLLDLHV